jgi:hypothetical protein
VLLPVPVDADVNTSALVTANETAGNIPENAAMHGNITRTVPIVTDEDGTKSNWFKVKLSSQPRNLVMVPTETLEVTVEGTPRFEGATLSTGTDLIIHTFVKELNSHTTLPANVSAIREDGTFDVMVIHTRAILNATQRIFQPNTVACRTYLERLCCPHCNNTCVDTRCFTREKFGGEGQIDSKTMLYFDTDNWMNFQMVVVVGMDDFVMDYARVFFIDVGPTESEDLGYNQRRSSLNGTNYDNDNIGLKVRIMDGLDQTSEDGKYVGKLAMRLGSQPKDTVLFTISSSMPNEASTSPQILAFSIDNWGVEQTITVRGIDDPFLDGDKLYDVNIKTLFTNDYDYKTAMLKDQAGLISLDDKSDRRPSDCAKGLYGIADSPDINLQCKKCPIGTFSDSTENTSTLDACKPCPFGTKGMPMASDLQTNMWLACAPCPFGNFSKHWDMYQRHGRFPDARNPPTECVECTNNKFCNFASMRPLDINLTMLMVGTQHHWNLLKTEVYETTAPEWLGDDITINENVLQQAILAIVMLSTSVVVLASLATCMASRMKLIENDYWLRNKLFLKNMDQFDDDHSKVKKDSIGGEDKRSMMGGTFTLMFFGLTWALLGIIFFMYLDFNEVIEQSLVPKSDDNTLLSTLSVQVTFVGYTGACPPKHTVVHSGVKFGGEDDVTHSIACGRSLLQISWRCKQCEISSPSLVVTLTGSSSFDEKRPYVVAASAIQWSLTASAVTPDESNRVNGTIKPEKAMTVFRGTQETTCTVALIPAKYKNAITTREMKGYRVQYMSEQLGTTVNQETFMDASQPNRVQFALKMTASAVQLDTSVSAKYTWLDIWAQAGGLFGAVGAGIIFMMNAIEIIIHKVLRVGKKKPLVWDTVGQAAPKNGKKGGKGGKGAPGGGAMDGDKVADPAGPPPGGPPGGAPGNPTDDATRVVI